MFTTCLCIKAQLDRAAGNATRKRGKLAIRLYIRVRPYRLRKDLCFVSGHNRSGCGRPMFCVRTRPYRSRKDLCFVSGHDFSRAVTGGPERAASISCRGLMSHSTSCGFP
jgi:hypothetical protein